MKKILQAIERAYDWLIFSWTGNLSVFIFMILSALLGLFGMVHSFSIYNLVLLVASLLGIVGYGLIGLSNHGERIDAERE